jgi:sulfatase maturation enzyme AslB (radical SAM superfamily)
MSVAPFHVLAKPIGPICNLDCKYCFYLEKEMLYPHDSKWAMPPDVLESYIRQYILHSAIHPTFGNTLSSSKRMRFSSAGKAASPRCW